MAAPSNSQKVLAERTAYDKGRVATGVVQRVDNVREIARLP